MKVFASCLIACCLIACCLIACLASTPAAAEGIPFDFGNTNASGSATTASEPAVNGIFQPGGEVVFTNSGLTVGAEAFGGNAFACGSDQCLAATYVTQQPGVLSRGASGIGESDSPTMPSDPDLGVAIGRYLVLDNAAAITAGWTTSKLVLDLSQAGLDVQIYGVNAIGGSLDLAALTAANLLLSTGTGCYASACTGRVVESASLANAYQYFVLTATGGNILNPVQGDFMVGEDILSNDPVPEPASIEVLGLALLGLMLGSRVYPGRKAPRRCRVSVA